MQALKEFLTEILSNAFESCGMDRKFGEVVASQRPDLSHFQCNGALAAARIHKRKGRDIAQNVIDATKERQVFLKISNDGPGFINLTLADDFLANHAQELALDERMLCQPVANPKRVVIDFGGPNIAKPMHVGHLRSAVIGDSLQRIFRFMGDHVISDIHLGDWGTQVGMLIREVKRRQPDLIYFDELYTGPYLEIPPVNITELEEMYPDASARCERDEREMQAALQATVELQQGRPGYRALWQHFRDISIEALKEDFEKLGVTFDLWFGESRYNDRIPEMIKRLKQGGFTRVSEGALVMVVLREAAEKEVPPLVLVKSDGGFLYTTTDLAAIEERVNDFQATQTLYVVDKRQELHFEQIFLAARLTGIARNMQLEHIAFGTVNGPDGKPFKTRQGGVMKLQNLISMATNEAMKRMAEIGIAEGYEKEEQLVIANKVGIATLKFSDLINYRTSDYTFDLERFTRFEGRTGPYLLYAAVRIKSILRKAEQMGFYPGAILPPIGPDRELILELSKFSEAVHNAYASRAPNHLCEFSYSLAQTFSRFYESCHILKERDPARRTSWLRLAELCLRQLERTLSLLGIEMAERM